MHRWLQRHRRLMLSLGICAAFVFLVRAGITQYRVLSGITSSTQSTSTKIAICGDGVVDFGEQCDDGNGVEGDGCSIGCVAEYCGDNLAQPLLGEECDGDDFAPDVVLHDGIMCGNDCRVGDCGPDDPPPPEWYSLPTDWEGTRMYHLCDDACSEVFIPRSYVVQWPDYFTAQNGFFFSQSHCQCIVDSGQPTDFWTCGPVGGICGDGVLDEGEQCDDSNTENGDGCSDECKQEVCGNGIVEGDEQCDPQEGSPEWYDGEPEYQPLDRKWCEKDICEWNDCSNGKDDDGDGDIDADDGGCYANENDGAIGFWQRWWRTLTAQVAPVAVFVPGKGFEDQCPLGHVYNKTTKMCDPTDCPVPVEGRDNVAAVTQACRRQATDDPQCKCVPGKPKLNDYDGDGTCEPSDRSYCVEWMVAACVCDCRNGTGDAAVQCYDECENNVPPRNGGGNCDVVISDVDACRAYAINQHCPAPDDDHGNGGGPGAGFGMGGIGPIFPPIGGQNGGNAGNGGDDGDGGTNAGTPSSSSGNVSSASSRASSRSSVVSPSSRSSAPSSPSSRSSAASSAVSQSSSPRSVSSALPCPSGQTCQNVVVCKDSGGRFGSACTPSTPDTVCCIPTSSSSVFVGCGDGKWNFVGVNNTYEDGKGDDEQCDDGNKTGGDGCGPTCKFEECYNGVIDPAGADKIPGTKDDEECDDGNFMRGDGCNEWCKIERCGNGIIDYNEECDNGDKNSDTVSHACRTNCMVARCGDGTVDDVNGSPSGYPEQCDCGLGFAPGDETNSDYECIQTQSDGAKVKCTYYCMVMYCYEKPQGSYILNTNYYPCLNGKLKDGTPCDACIASSRSSSSSSSSRSTGSSPHSASTSSRRSSSSTRTGTTGPGGGPGGSVPRASSAPDICQLYPWVCVPPPSSGGLPCNLYPTLCPPSSRAVSFPSSVQRSSSPGLPSSGPRLSSSARSIAVSSARSAPSSTPILCRSGAICPDGTPCPPSGICPPRSSSRISLSFPSSRNRCFTDDQCPLGQRCYNGICGPNISSNSFASLRSQQSSAIVVFFQSSARTTPTSAVSGIVGGNVGGQPSCRGNLDCPGGTRCIAGACTPYDETPVIHGDIGGVLTGQLPTDQQDVLAARALCGNGAIDSGEECEDGNVRDFDGCSSDCLMERGICGDGTVQTLLGEQCEPATHDPNLPYACSGHCRFFSSLCGNGVQDPGEECDLGPANSEAPGATCRVSCSLARCGDGIVDVPFETCDDSNRVGGDGCGRQCQEERGAPLTEVTGGVFQVPVTPARPYDTQYVTAQVSPIHAPVAQTGPASIAAMAAGAAAGIGWMRRRRARKS